MTTYTRYDLFNSSRPGPWSVINITKSGPGRTSSFIEREIRINVGQSGNLPAHIDLLEVKTEQIMSELEFFSLWVLEL